MDTFIKEAIKSVQNIVQDTQCNDLKAGLRGLIDYPGGRSSDDMKKKCLNLLECHEECITPNQYKTAKLIMDNTQTL